MTDFTARLAMIRRAYPVLRSDRFLHGGHVRPGLPDISWSEPDGAPMTPEGWHDASRGALMLQLAGPAAAHGGIDVLLILLNASGETVHPGFVTASGSVASPSALQIVKAGTHAET